MMVWQCSKLQNKRYEASNYDCTYPNRSRDDAKGYDALKINSEADDTLTVDSEADDASTDVETEYASTIDAQRGRG